MSAQCILCVLFEGVVEIFSAFTNFMCVFVYFCISHCGKSSFLRSFLSSTLVNSTFYSWNKNIWNQYKMSVFYSIYVNTCEFRRQVFKDIGSGVVSSIQRTTSILDRPSKTGHVSLWFNCKWIVKFKRLCVLASTVCLALPRRNKIFRTRSRNWIGFYWMRKSASEWSERPVNFVIFYSHMPSCH